MIFADPVFGSAFRLGTPDLGGRPYGGSMYSVGSRTWLRQIIRFSEMKIALDSCPFSLSMSRGKGLVER